MRFRSIKTGYVKSGHLSMEESVAGFGISSTLWQKSSRKRHIKRIDGFNLGVTDKCVTILASDHLMRDMQCNDYSL
jgi:hypothetical protein